MFTVKRTITASLISFVVLCSPAAFGQQSKITVELNIGQERPRLAVPEFKAATLDSQTPALNTAFNETLWGDLDNAGIFEMVAKSFYPLSVPSNPGTLQAASWSTQPTNAGLVAFGNLGLNGGKVDVQGWLIDVKNPASPPVLGKQYREDGTVDNARLIAHRFADEIIARLGGIPGIAESKIYFISNRSGAKEVWSMDYDGANQKQLTRLNSIALAPQVSPDRSRIAFTALGKDSWQIMMHSFDLGRLVSFPRFGGDTFSTAWSPDGTRIAFASAMHGGASEIYISDASGGGARRLTSSRGGDVSPVFNPKTGSQIAFVSGRTGLPQIYIMDSDGSNVQRITDQGYAVSPAWSPNGMLLAFSWVRNYGPGILGGADIYLMDIASRQIVQLTHDGGRNDFPSWSPDGRHIVFESTRSGTPQIWSVLGDGTHPQQLTRSGRNTQPNWSYQ
jgi:TolB protein